LKLQEMVVESSFSYRGFLCVEVYFVAASNSRRQHGVVIFNKDQVGWRFLHFVIICDHGLLERDLIINCENYDFESLLADEEVRLLALLH
jgi:hypothetical protein